MKIATDLLMLLKAVANQYVQKRRPGADLRVDAVDVDNRVQFHCYTQIDCGAKYLLILQPILNTTPLYLLIKGSDLYTSAMDDHQGTDLQAGVIGYLNLHGHYEDIESVHVEVHKLTPRMLLELDFVPSTM